LDKSSVVIKLAGLLATNLCLLKGTALGKSSPYSSLPFFTFYSSFCIFSKTLKLVHVCTVNCWSFTTFIDSNSTNGYATAPTNTYFIILY